MSDLPGVPWTLGDLRKASTATFATLKLPTADTLQCIAFGDTTGDVYTSQGVPQSEGSTVEDTYYSLHRNGVRLSTMKIVGGGHGTVFARHPDDGLLINWPGRGLFRIPFTPGTAAPDAGVPWGGRFAKPHTVASVDHDHGNVLLRTDGVCTLRAIADVEAGVDRILGQASTSVDDPRVRQGWCSYGPEMLYLVGSRDRDQTIEVYDLTTGKLKYARSGKLCGDLAWQEPEGIIVAGGKVFVGFTLGPRPYTHKIMSLSAYDAHLSTDSGQWFVAVDELNGRRADGSIRLQRHRGDPLWIRRITRKTLAGMTRDWAVTGFSTYYAAELLTREAP